MGIDCIYSMGFLLPPYESLRIRPHSTLRFGGKMANIDNPNGFRYEFRYSDGSPPVATYLQKASTTLNAGDPVALEAGYLILAGTGVPVLGVVMGPAAVDDTVQNGTPIVAGAGETPGVMIILAFNDVVFRVQDGDATPATQALIGTLVDMAGATGAVEIASAVSTNDDVLLLALADLDNIAGNTWGANADFLVTFTLSVLG